jgi:hypothetical protein
MTKGILVANQAGYCSCQATAPLPGRCLSVIVHAVWQQYPEAHAMSDPLSNFPYITGEIPALERAASMHTRSMHVAVGAQQLLETALAVTAYRL